MGTLGGGVGRWWRRTRTHWARRACGFSRSGPGREVRVFEVDQPDSRRLRMVTLPNGWNVGINPMGDGVQAGCLSATRKF